MKHLVQTLLLGLGLALLATLAQAQTCGNPKTLRLSLIPKKSVTALTADYQPLVKALEARLQRPVEIVVAPSYGAVVEGLLAASVDLAELGPASYAQAKARDEGITAFASLIQRVGLHTDASDSYRSLLIARRDKAFKDVASLRGVSVSLIDPASTSGALIPRQAIQQLTGEPLERYFGRITFAGAHDRAIQAVQKGFVDAAFVSSSRLDEGLRTGSVGANEIVVLWQSAPIPYDPFVYRSHLCPELIDKIKPAFFNSGSALQGMFDQLHAQGFTPVNDTQYRQIREIYANQP